MISVVVVVILVCWGLASTSLALQGNTYVRTCVQFGAFTIDNISIPLLKCRGSSRDLLLGGTISPLATTLDGPNNTDTHYLGVKVSPGKHIQGDK